MALSKIRQANKRWKHQQRRNKKQQQAKETIRRDKIVSIRTRKFFLQGQREHEEKRRAERKYIDELAEGISSEAR